MKLGIITTVVIILILAGAFFVYTNLPKNNPSPNGTENTKKVTAGITDRAETGYYGPYSPDTFKNSNAAKKVLYFFATWCPECKEADKDFKENIDDLPADVAVFKVHYNDPETTPDDKDLAKKYGIVYQHTFVQINNEGNQITKWNGGGLEKLLSSIK